MSNSIQSLYLAQCFMWKYVVYGKVNLLLCLAKYMQWRRVRSRGTAPRMLTLGTKWRWTVSFTTGTVRRVYVFRNRFSHVCLFQWAGSQISIHKIVSKLLFLYVWHERISCSWTKVLHYALNYRYDSVIGVIRLSYTGSFKWQRT
jgi:hypothetical protein